MGYWTSYLGYGYGVARPLFDDSPTLLYNPLVVGASLLLPALATAGFLWTRRLRYGPFLVLLVVVGVFIMAAGFPDGTQVRKAMEWIYREAWLVRFMRTTQKAAPLVAVGVAGLLGLGRPAGVGAPARAAARTRPHRGPDRRAGGAGGADPAGRAAADPRPGPGQPAQLEADPGGMDGHRPRARPRAARELARAGAARLGLLLLQLGRHGRLDPSAGHRAPGGRCATRRRSPTSHSVELLTAVDSLVQQRRLFPGQLRPLLGLIGVGAVVSGSDNDLSRSGVARPGLGRRRAGRPRPRGALAPLRPARSRTARPATSARRSSCRRCAATTCPRAAGIVHVAPEGPATIVDGSAPGWSTSPRSERCPSAIRILYAADLSARELRSPGRAGRRDGGHRLQPAPPVRPPVRPAERRPHPARERGHRQERRIHQPVHRVRPRRPDGRGARGRELRPDAAPRPTPRSSPSTRRWPPSTATSSTSWVADRLAPDTEWWVEIGFERAARRALRGPAPAARRSRHHPSRRRERRRLAGRARLDPRPRGPERGCRACGCS